MQVYFTVNLGKNLHLGTRLIQFSLNMSLRVDLPGSRRNSTFVLLLKDPEKRLCEGPEGSGRF